MPGAGTHSPLRRNCEKEKLREPLLHKTQRPPAPSLQGRRAVTLSGAVKAAFKRVLDREYDKAMIYDPIGSVQFVIRRAGNKLVTVTKGI